MKDSYREGGREAVALYVKLKQKVQVHEPKLLLGQIADLWCGDSRLLKHCSQMEIHSFSPDQDGRVHYDIVEILEKLSDSQEALGQVLVLGEESGFAEYIPPKRETFSRKLLEIAKIVMVCLISFCGGAFAIMTFNKDVNVDEILTELYTFVTGRTAQGFCITQLGYCIGIPLGILGFFVHFRKEKRLTDPTPFQVQLREYEQEINETIMINHERQRHEDNG